MRSTAIAALVGLLAAGHLGPVAAGTYHNNNETPILGSGLHAAPGDGPDASAEAASAAGNLVSDDKGSQADSEEECVLGNEFYIYHQGHHGPPKSYWQDGYFRNYFFLPDKIQIRSEECDDSQHVFDLRNDVTGALYGVRCKGCDDDFGGQDIDELEFRGEGYGHWTLYRDRDFGMYDTEDHRIGRCEPMKHRNFYWCGDLWNYFRVGQAMYKCKLEGDVRPC